MNRPDTFLSKFDEYGPQPAFVCNDQVYSYSWLSDQIRRIQEQLLDNGIQNKTVAFHSGYSPIAIALFFALIELKNTLVPISIGSENNAQQCMEIANVQYVVTVLDTGAVSVSNTNHAIQNEILAQFMKRGAAGLILFSSGTTGIPKAILQDADKIVSRYENKGKRLTTITFLLMDHIGGVNTFLSQLANAGTLVLTDDKSTANICSLIEKYQVELLPVTPSFLNLLLLSEDYKKYDLSSLKIITYGTEVIPDYTLHKFHEMLPHIKLKQTYGLTEVGILSSISESPTSKWLKLGGYDYQLKVIDNILRIKSSFSMVGYLNAPSPFDEEGWFITGDIVETQGDYFHILGRKSDIINVGGLKVFPQEVENVILQIPEVEEVTVAGEKNAILGNIVVARIKSCAPQMSAAEMKRLVQQKCRGVLPDHKIPVKVYLVGNALYNGNFKKSRVGV